MCGTDFFRIFADMSTYNKILEQAENLLDFLENSTELLFKTEEELEQLDLAADDRILLTPIEMEWIDTYTSIQDMLGKFIDKYSGM